MTQLISIFLEDENGKIIQKCEINFANVINEAWELKNFKTNFPWISSVDPYGNTIINILQSAYVLEELARLKKNIKDRTDIDIVIDFINKIEQHLYIKFVGD